MKAKILIGQPLSADHLKRLNAHHQVDCIKEATQRYEQVYAVIDDYDALLCMNHRADQPLMDKAKNLKVISNHGVGYDNVDVEYAKAKGIAVTNLPRSTSAPTANMAIGLLLSLMRKITLHDRALRQGSLGDWDNPQILGSSPEQKTLGIIGMGRIGKEVAKRAIVLGMKVCYFNRRQLPPETEASYQATYVSLEDLLKDSDVISLHTPLNDSTYHLISTAQLNRMKPTAYLINTARGGVIDHEALIAALRLQKIAGAGLDVFPNEPQIPQALLGLDNVILTPHNGTGTVEARKAMFEEAFSNIIAFLAGEDLEARVV